MKKRDWVTLYPNDVLVVRYGNVNSMFQIPIDDVVVNFSKKSKSEVRRLMKNGAVKIFIYQKEFTS